VLLTAARCRTSFELVFLVAQSAIAFGLKVCLG
jgi:hypothetical protein